MYHPPMNRIHEIGFSTKMTIDTGEVISACLNNAVLHERIQNSHLLYFQSIAKVERSVWHRIFVVDLMAILFLKQPQLMDLWWP